MTGGGLNEAGDWVAVRHGFLLPMAVVMALFRGKLLAAIRQGVAQGQLTLPASTSRQKFENQLNKLGRQKWNVHIRERYPHGEGVLIYLARSCALSAVSHLLATGTRRHAQTVRQQLREWYDDVARKRGTNRQALRVETGFRPLLGWVVSWW